MEIADFVGRCVERAGGLAERVSPNVLETLAPDGLGSSIEPGRVMRLALDGEAVGRFRDAVPVLPGSPALDGFIDWAIEHGRLTRASVQTGRLRPRSIARDVQAAMTFAVGRVRLPEAPADVAIGAVAQFDFIVALTSDEKQEALQSVVVDLVTGAACPILSWSAWALDLDPETASASAQRISCSLDEAHHIAIEALREWSVPRIARHQELVARRLRDEHRRIELYYHATVEDLRRRAASASGDRAGALTEKIEATRREEEAKLAELGEKYRIRPLARLVAMRWLTYPRLFATVHLDHKHATRSLEVNWDPVTGQLRLPLCESCRRATDYLEMTRETRLVCRACAADKSP